MAHLTKIGVRMSGYTIPEAVERYLEKRRNRLAPESLRNYQSVLSIFGDYFPRRTLGRLTMDDMVRYFDASRSRLEARTLHERYYVTRGFLNYAANRKWCPHGLLDDVELPPLPRNRHKFIRLTDLQLVDLVEDETDPRSRAVLAHLVNTACRASEVTPIRIRDVDFERGDVYTVIDKSNDAEYMPITEDLRLELDLWLPSYRLKLATHFSSDLADITLDPAWYLYPAQRSCGTKVVDGVRSNNPLQLRPESKMGYHSVRRIVDVALKRLGYSTAELEKEGAHTIRRAVARHYFDLLRDRIGYSHGLREVQALLHHARSETTEHYLGLDVERLSRDATMRGKPFILANAKLRRANESQGANVVQFPTRTA